MKKLLTSLTLAVLILLSSVVHAADKVVVVPLGGTHVYIDPANIVSAYCSPGTNQVVMTVPTDKHFVLTDIVGSAVVTIYENADTKLKAVVGGVYANSYGVGVHPAVINISSGIVFQPGAEVRATIQDYGDASPTGFATISGYYY